MEEMFEEEIDTYEIGYTKFDEIAVCQTITWKYTNKEEKEIQFHGIGISKHVQHFHTAIPNVTYKDMLELKSRYEWIEVPYKIYKHMLQYIAEHSPF